VTLTRVVEVRVMTIEERRGPDEQSPPPPLPEAPARTPAQAAPAAPSAAPGGEPLAIKRSVIRALGFGVLSFGLYNFYWFYVTRKEASRELGTDDDAALQTAGLLVPVLNWVITYWLWRDINRLRARVGLSEFSIPLYLVLSIIGLMVIFYALVVSHLNEYWDRRTGGRATNAPVTRNEKLVVAAGALLWLVWAGSIAVVVAVAAS
jgi:hypothetical protein